MRWTVTARASAWLLVALALFGGRQAAAIEIELPGERKMEIHGFYETRLLFVGADLPANDETFSSFRHVLSLDVDIEIAPDGWGPFDLMAAFARFAVSYECIYERACNTFSSADSFGDSRKPVRQSASLVEAKNPSPYFGGLLLQRYDPGSLKDPREELTPGRRYRDCINLPGVARNPFPLAAFCNFNNRSQLDGPLDGFAGAPVYTRAGHFNAQGRLNLLLAARPSIGEARFQELRRQLIAGNVVDFREEAIRRSLIAKGYRLAKDDPAGSRAAFDEAAAMRAGTFDEAVPELLGTRPDVNRFTSIANEVAPELITSRWGAGQIGSSITPFLATISTPIKPLGYFQGGTSIDFIGELDEGLAEDVNPLGLTATIPPILANNRIVVEGSLNRDVLVYYTGADGIRNTPDDLPFFERNPRSLVNPAVGIHSVQFGPRIAGSQFDDRFERTLQVEVDDASNPGQTKIVELYAEFTDFALRQNGCLGRRLPGGVRGVFNAQTGECRVNGELVAEQLLLDAGCSSLKYSGNESYAGYNGDGKCISVAGGFGSSFELLPLLSNPNFRPAGVNLEPIDATDYQVGAQQSGIGPVLITAPARPRAANNGLVFYSQGTRRVLRSKHHIVSNLDLDFSEGELEWDHGSSQDEHEFKEGFLELEMFDSQLYMRLGKLIKVWGKTELFRNQDRLNPVDIGNGLFQPLEEARIGQWGAQFTINPEAWMRIGPLEDVRLEVLALYDDFEPTDLGKCGEGTIVELVCLKSFGAMAHGLTGIGVVGEIRPDSQYDGLKQMDFGMRLEGRWDRFTWAVSDFWGWDDGFYIDVVGSYGRSVDKVTGAPTTGPGQRCRIRTNDAGQPIGPNGIAGDYDDGVASAGGGCLLYSDKTRPADPANPGGITESIVRNAAGVARLHTVNQQLFHTICTLSFDADTGYCAFDQITNPNFFPLTTQALGGQREFVAAAITGANYIRTPDKPFRGFRDEDEVGTLVTRVNQNSLVVDLGRDLTVEQQALFGCGPHYLAPCSTAQRVAFTSPSAGRNLARDIGRDQNTLPGGIDLMNTDASVLTGDWAVLKALSPDALIGTRKVGKEGLAYLPGINHNRRGAPIGKTPGQVINTPRIERANFAGATRTGPYSFSPNTAGETDGWIEPMPWTVNRDALRKFGAVVFNVANRSLMDPRCDPTPGNPHYDPNNLPPACTSARPNNNPFDPSNPLNEFNWVKGDRTTPDGVVYGEWCATTFGTNNPFFAGCSATEVLSANFERFLIGNEIVGFDDRFDPPESLAELAAWGANNFSLHTTGDPISGADGIFTRTDFVFDPDQKDALVVDRLRNVPTLVGPTRDQIEAASGPGAAPGELQELFKNWIENEFRPEDCPTSRCFLRVGFTNDLNRDQVRIDRVASVPVSALATLIGNVDPAGGISPAAPGTLTRVNLLLLDSHPDFRDPELLAQLFAGEVVGLPDGRFVQIPEAELAIYFPRQDTDQAAIGQIDLNFDAASDLDEDYDGVYDGIDDFTPGPITDDNILCGSGIPGDLLQDGIQYEPYRRDEAIGSAKFKQAFPNGLPPRSPVFCRSVAGLAGATGQTLPRLQAGGNGAFGRRDFLWHSGQEIVFDYQKRNVFGFALDFAEDVTKTSWGIEFSWTANKLFPNNRERSGLSESDELVLSVSVDRPTFFNFLNPNRSFFINFQFFVRWLPQYEGNSRDRDGMYGTASGELEVPNVVLTFFTGYFQDRLSPRASLLWVPSQSQYAVLSGLSYRFNESFSTSIAFSHFFGHISESGASYYPISLYSSPEQFENTLFRGITPVINRDQLNWRVRYSF